jgi:hypothetical protein
MRSRVLFAAVLVALVAASAAAASGGVRIVGDCRQSQVRPSSIVLACADDNTMLTHLRWSSFGGATARASGDYAYNDCNPYCAAGHVHSYPVTVVFSAPKRCPDGHRDYQSGEAAWSTGRRPSGSLGKSSDPGKLSLSCPLK